MPSNSLGMMKRDVVPRVRRETPPPVVDVPACEPDIQKSRDFIVNSMSVYAVSLLSIFVRLAIPYDGVQIYATMTTFAYALPFLFFLGDPPMIVCALLVTTIQGSGSAAHHARGCLDDTYRVLDIYGYILTYTVITTFSVNKVLSLIVPPRFTRVIIFRCMLITGVTLVTAFFEDVVDQEMIVLPVLGVSAGIVLILCYRFAYNQDLSTLIGWTATLLVLFGVAYYLNVSGDSPWDLTGESILQYELPHGLWHVFTAQGQFLFICLILSEGVRPLQSWDWCVVLVNLALVASIAITNATGGMGSIVVAVTSTIGTVSWLTFSLYTYRQYCKRSV